jgi:hypothetical protein
LTQGEVLQTIALAVVRSTVLGEALLRLMGQEVVLTM